MDKDLATTLAHDIFSVNKFESHGYSPKGLAQKNLMGKTHYVDDSTLRYHHSRVLECYSAHESTVCTIIESCALDMNNTKRGFRFVAFDLGGEVLERVDLETTFKTKKQAQSAMWSWLDAFDASAHYKDKIQDMVRKDNNRIDVMQKTLATLNKDS